MVPVHDRRHADARRLELTAWKARQLGLCREAPCCRPVRRPDARAAFRHGLHLGAHCSRCCGGLMAVLLVAGVMDLDAMALVAGAITFERLAPWPERAARTCGVLVIAAGALVMARALGA